MPARGTSLPLCDRLNEGPRVIYRANATGGHVEAGRIRCVGLPSSGTTRRLDSLRRVLLATPALLFLVQLFLGACGAPRDTAAKPTFLPAAGTATGLTATGAATGPAAGTGKAALANDQVVDPAAALHGQFHAAGYQIDQALESLGAVVGALKPLPAAESGDTKKALVDLIAVFDAIGRQLSEGTAPPDLDEVRKDVKGSDRRRAETRTHLEASIAKLKNGQNTLADMLGSEPPAPVKAALQAAADAADETLGFLEEADRQLTRP